MKRLTKRQKLSAIIGTGLLIAAASGSAFAMHTAEDGGQQRNAVRHEKTPAAQTPTPHTSLLPAPTSQPSDEVEFQGTVEGMSDLWVVGGRTVAVTTATEIKAGLSIGTLAKLHAVRHADGSLWAREIEPARGIASAEHHDQDNGNSNDNSHDGQGNGNGNIGSNNDNGNSNDNGHDDQGNGNGSISSNDNGNDDHGNVSTDNDNGNNNTGHDAGSSVNTNDDHGHGNHGGNEDGNNDGNSNGNHGG